MSRLNQYPLRTDVICEVTFRNEAGAVHDPDAVFFIVADPADVETTYTYGTDPEIVRDGVGEYHVNVDAVLPGRWYYSFYSEGTGKAADERAFLVKKSHFVIP